MKTSKDSTRHRDTLRREAEGNELVILVHIYCEQTQKVIHSERVAIKGLTESTSLNEVLIALKTSFGYDKSDEVQLTMSPRGETQYNNLTIYTCRNITLLVRPTTENDPKTQARPSITVTREGNNRK